MSEENKKEKQWYLDNFESFEKNLNGEKESYTHAVRREAAAKLASVNFPTLKDEEWKYTNVSPIIKNNFMPAVSPELPVKTAKEIEEKIFCGFECHRIVFVNGIFNEELSDIKPLPAGVILGSLRRLAKENKELIEKHLTAEEGNAFSLLNSAYSIDGLFAYIPKGKSVEHPVQVLYLNGKEGQLSLSSPKNLIIAGEASEVNIVMNFSGAGGESYFTNASTKVFTAKNAVVNIYKIQNENTNAYHIERVDAVQEESSFFNHYNMTFGGAIVRNDINSALNGENCECHYYGLYLGSGKQHIDNHTFVDHAKPNCMSNELYKGILDDTSRGVFNGKIMVRPDAQKTNAYQSNKTILLSEKAVIDTKPQLEIFADDVKCSHGATIGHLDDTAYFYIRSRGVPADLAKSMLIRAFANDVIESVKIPELKERLNHMIFDHLHRVEITNQ